MERAYENMFTETEITYVLEVLKNKDDDWSPGAEIMKFSVQQKYYKKAVKTFQILMIKQGL